MLPLPAVPIFFALIFLVTVLSRRAATVRVCEVVKFILRLFIRCLFVAWSTLYQVCAISLPFSYLAMPCCLVISSVRMGGDMLVLSTVLTVIPLFLRVRCTGGTEEP